MTVRQLAEEFRAAIHDDIKRFASESLSGYQGALSFSDDELVLRVLLGRLTGRARKNDFDVDAIDGDRQVVVTRHTAGEDTAYLLVSAFGSPPRGTILVQVTTSGSPPGGPLLPSAPWSSSIGHRFRACSPDRNKNWFEDERLLAFTEAAMNVRPSTRVEKLGFQ